MVEIRLKGKGDMEKDEGEVSINEILVKLMQSDEDLPLKTRVYRPKDLAILKVIGTFLKPTFTDFSKVLLKFIRFFEEYEVSDNGEGRKEMFNAISSIMDKERLRMSFSERLTTNLKK